MANATPGPEKKPGEEISLDDIDALISSEDPTFGQQMTELSADEDLKAADVQGQGADLSEDLGGEPEELAQSTAAGLKAKLKTFFGKIKARLKMAMTALKNRFLLTVRSTWQFLRHGLPEFFKFVAAQLGIAFKYVGGKFSQFKAMPLWQKATVVLVLGLSGALFMLVKWNLRGQWLPGLGTQYVVSMAQVADHEIEREAGSKEVDFYMAFPQPEFTLLLSKVVVNLKPDGEGNPMAAFQAFVITESEATSSEIKTREKEMIDLIGRTAEDFTYQELSTEPGKERLKREIRKTINGALTQGQVLSTYFKVFISKP